MHGTNWLLVAAPFRGQTVQNGSFVQHETDGRRADLARLSLEAMII